MRPPVSGPSFLGLGDDRSRDLDYLLEDEAPRSHGRLYLALILLMVSAALLAWQWRRDGDYWSKILKAVNSSVGTSPAPAPAPPADTTAQAAPVTPVEPTANPAAPETQTPTGETAKPPAEEPAGGGSPPAGAAAVTKPVEQASQPDDASPAPAAKTPSPASGSEPEAAEPASQEPQVAAKTAMPKAISRKPSPAAAASSFEDRLVADGERYLYGRGVPEDCNRAQRNLQIAARQENPKAETLLGAMYATGHCVGRDLPTSYRWFAKALHGDPGNSRVQRDLEVLWKQMTPEERLLAMKGQ
ncbi:MAG: hypothetical protein ACRD20_05075 [Terriglobales bacterium]